MLKIIVINLSFWLALVSTLLHIEVWVKRIIMAIRQQDIKWDSNFCMLAFYWTLFLLSTMIVGHN